MLEQRIQQHFFESADLQYQIAENLARPAALMAQALVDCITSGGKLICLGFGLSQLDARYVAELMLGRFEQDRPPLGAISLFSEQDALRQIQALGHPGDVLLLLNAHGAPAQAVQPAIEAAHAQDLTLLLLAGANDAAINAQLTETDLPLWIAHPRAARVSEIHRLLAHCLCDAVDMQLLGSND